MIIDRRAWEDARREGIARFVVTRAVAFGLVAGVGYVVIGPTGPNRDVNWRLALAFLVGGMIYGLLWALFQWHMRSRAFERNG